MAMQKHETAPESTAPVEKGAFRRRGLIAGAAALAAGVLATRMGSDAVDAADNSSLLLGAANNANNTEATLTTLTTPTTGSGASFAPTTAGFRVQQASVAVLDTSFDALQGFATAANNSGVHGRNDALNGIGTTGVATNGTGVYGQSSTGSAIGGASVGIAPDGHGAGAGVYGTSTSSSGVQGTSSSGNGVFGQSATGYGVIGYSTGGSASLSGISTNANIPAFAGGNAVAGGLAASFSGTVFVNGSFVVNDPTQKHGAIKGSDNKYRLLYSMESPEPWMEDFGTGQLVNGAAEINLDPVFADVSHTDDYHVFITEQDGTHHHLSVTSRTGQSFKVGADIEGAALKGKKASDLNGTFSWRLVAKPKSSNSATRFAPFNIPNVKLPDPATLPKQVVPKRRG